MATIMSEAAQGEERVPRKRDKGRRGSVTARARGQELLTLAEAAERSGMKRNTLNHAALDGKLEAVRVGYQWLVTAAAVDAWVKAAAHRPGPEPNSPTARNRWERKDGPQGEPPEASEA